MRIAILGGTFDPIHRAHLIVGREAADQFHLDRILFIPAGNPPFKHAAASFAHRLKMVEAACEGESRFVASRLEEGDKKSYSIDTIERVRADGGDVYFVVGADAFAEIRSWHRATDVIRSVEFIVVTRPGHEYEIPPGAKVHRLETLALPDSSSEIRRALASGQTPSDLPPKVAEYIRKNGLYRT
jgi:nicotinate-nucleotide adenylyltransferase